MTARRGGGRGASGALTDDPLSIEPHVLREYALLADGERGILLGPRGEFSWMCFPTWESDAVFSTLIGGAGAYAITPRDRFVWGGYYEPGSLIWRSRWVTVGGSIVECREALALPATPTRAVVLRRVIACDGDARVAVGLNPRGGFGDEPLRGLRLAESGTWHGRIGEVSLTWTGGARATVSADGHRGRALRFELTLHEGDYHDFVLTLASGVDDAAPPDPELAWSATEAVWRERVPAFESTAAPRDARHAYALLHGLTSAGGGMVAAATMSLPERARGGRNYDYRYAWIRDQCYAGRAAANAGLAPLLDSAIGFARDRLLDHGPKLRPAYTTSGGRIPDERPLELDGYPGAAVVCGNWVNEQFQLDVFGEVLLLFADGAAHDRLDADAWRAVEIATATIADRWHEPDAGIWELPPDEWTHSRLVCAAGLRAISARRPGGDPAGRWLGLADAITADCSARSLHRSGRWQRSPTDARIDAALLLASIHGAIAADDPRTLATLRAVESTLTQDGYVYRFRPDRRPLGEAEGAFLFCGFLMALALHQQRDAVGAVRWFERNRAACGTPGLLCEEYDVTQRQLRGNFPQAFVHALLLQCAVELEPQERIVQEVSDSRPSGIQPL